MEGTEKEAYINGLNTRDDRKFTVKNIDNKVRIVDAKGNALGAFSSGNMSATDCIANGEDIHLVSDNNPSVS